MKRLLITILILSGIFCVAKAQQKKIDSLKRVLANSHQDTATILLSDQLAYCYLYSKPDSSLLLGKIMLSLSKKSAFIRGQGRAYKDIGDALEQMGNYPGAMNAYLNLLHLAEMHSMKLENIQALTNLGILYYDQNDYRQATDYTLKAKKTIEGISDKSQLKNYDLNREVILLNIGYDYYKMNLLDSALVYEQNAYELSVRIRDVDDVDDILLNLGLIQQKYNNKSLALTYFRMGTQKAADINDFSTLTHCYQRTAEYYKSYGQIDSSIYYAKKAYGTAERSSYTKGILDASTILADILGEKDKSAAYDYLKSAITANDSLFNEEKVKQLQNLRFEELSREQELNEIKRKQVEEERNNLQLSAIALFIPVFFLILLILSKVQIHHRVIESMSILSILFLFEFITLLLHSYVGDLANHTPYLEFTAFVFIAAIMIPLHHRFNHWLIKRLTNVHKWGKHKEPVVGPEKNVEP